MKNGFDWLEVFWKAYLFLAIGALLVGLIIPLVVMR